MDVFLFFFVLIFIVFIIICGVFYVIENKRDNALKLKTKAVWDWLVNEVKRRLSSSTNGKASKIQDEQPSVYELFRQIEKVDACLKDSLSTIEKTLIDILEHQKSLREEQERVQQVCSSISTQQNRQTEILRDLSSAIDTMSNINHRQEIEVTSSSGIDSVNFFKELFCRQLSEEKDGFNVNDLTDSPKNNCYIIKQYDETHATLNIVDDSLVRSQMISGFIDFIAPICDFDGQSPAGKNSFEVKETGELEIYCEKWLIKKKIKIQLF